MNINKSKMIQTRINGDQKITYSDTTYTIHRIGTDEYFNYAVDPIDSDYEYEEYIPGSLEDVEEYGDQNLSGDTFNDQ